MFEKYFSGIGIDFSEHHVRFAHVGLFGHVLQCKEVVLDEGIVLDEQIVDTKAFQAIVKKTVSEMGLSTKHMRTVCLIPESRVFSHSFLSDATLKKEELEELAHVRAQKEIPLNFESARIDVSFGEKESQEVQTTVYAVDAPVVQGIETSFVETGLHLMAIESNIQSIFRLKHVFQKTAVKKRDQKMCDGVLDIGHAWATLSFCTQNGSRLFSRTISYKQQNISANIPGELLDEIVDSLIGITEGAVLYFQSQNYFVNLFLLAGTEARTANMVQAIKTRLPQISPSYAGDLLKHSKMKKTECQIFAASIGAGLRAAQPHTYISQHNFFNVSV
jgi:Tfp pilus assembly PilM family ATPase